MSVSKKKGKEKQRVNPPPPIPSIKLIKNESRTSTVPAPSAPSTALDITNRFTPLGTIVQPQTFVSTVSTPFDPYAKAIASKGPTLITPQFFLPKGNSLYMKKPILTHLFHIEPSRSSSTDPFKIASSYFPPNFHWIPEDSSKNLQFYSSILILTNSLIIKPIYDKNDSTKLIYHSAYILRVITEDEWATNPFTLKKLHDSALSYNYFDYITAWRRFMFFQVPDMSHSWFFNFDKRFKGTFPYWFLQWWDLFGLIPQNLPEQLARAFEFYKQFAGTKLNRHNQMFPPELHFCKTYKLPWIFKWTYERNANLLDRAYFTKWWDRYGYTEKVIDQMIKDFPQVAPDLEDKKEFPAIKSGSVIPEYPLVIQTPNSPTASTRGKAASSSSKKSSKSAKDNILSRLGKKDLLKLLEQQLSKSTSDNSEENSEASSEASYSNIFGHDSEGIPKLEDD